MEEALKWLNDNEGKWEYNVAEKQYKLLVEDAPEEVVKYLEQKNANLKMFRNKGLVR